MLVMCQQLCNLRQQGMANESTVRGSVRYVFSVHHQIGVVWRKERIVKSSENCWDRNQSVC